MDYQTFPTKAAAQSHIGTMRGWQCKPMRVYAPDAPGASRAGNVWVIECAQGHADPLYLRSDGYVR